MRQQKEIGSISLLVAIFVGVIVVVLFVAGSDSSNKPVQEELRIAKVSNPLKEPEVQPAGESKNGLEAQPEPPQGERQQEQHEPEESQNLFSLITRAVDADTFDVVLPDGSEDRVRLLGVDAPETYGPNQAYEYGSITNTACLDEWGETSKWWAADLLEGSQVLLGYDPLAGERGYYGRLLAYIEVDGNDFGSLLIQRGYARTYTESNFQKEETYVALQNQAEAREVGLWSCEGQEPEPEPEQQEWTCSSNAYNCSDFTSQSQAQSVFEQCGGVNNDIHRLDGDNDAKACESLP